MFILVITFFNSCLSNQYVTINVVHSPVTPLSLDSNKILICSRIENVEKLPSRQNINTIIKDTFQNSLLFELNNSPLSNRIKPLIIKDYDEKPNDYQYIILFDKLDFQDRIETGTFSTDESMGNNQFGCFYTFISRLSFKIFSQEGRCLFSNIIEDTVFSEGYGKSREQAFSRIADINKMASTSGKSLSVNFMQKYFPYWLAEERMIFGEH